MQRRKGVDLGIVKTDRHAYYYDENLLQVETNTYGDGIARTVSYTYDPDGRRATLTYPNNAYTFNYTCTGRSQLNTIINNATSQAVVRRSATATKAYLYGPNRVVKNLATNNHYYQDASGSTTHLSSNTGVLLESYRYDLHGTPIFYNSLNQ